MVPLMK